MATIVTRAGKGSPLTNTEVDDNFTNLNAEVTPLRHSIRPSLLLDFANSKQLDPRITFSRASTGTYYDGKTFAKAEENLLTSSENLGWGGSVSITYNNEVAPNGELTADTFSFSSASSYAYSPVINTSNVNGRTFTFSGWIWSTTGKASVSVRIAGATTGAGDDSYQNISLTTTPVRFSITRTMTSSDTSIVVGFDNRTAFGGDGITGDFVAWGIQVEERDSATAYTPTTTQPITNYIPVLQTAAAGTARFDHDPVTGESKGLLIEEQRTNLLTYSEQFDNASWAYNLNSVINQNVIVAPDGTLTADKLVETTATALHGVGTAASIFTAGGTYTISVFAKAAERTRLLVAFANDAGDPATFDLANGTVVSTGAGNLGAFINAVGNGWYRCVSVVSPTKANPYPTFILDNGTTNNYTGDGYSGIYIWGAQLEAGAFPTSYIKTTSAQATRNADAASMTGTNFSSWYRQDEGTLYVDANGGPRIVFSNANSGYDNYRSMYLVGNNILGYEGHNGTTSVGTFTLNGSSNVFKFAYAYKQDDFAFTRDGNSPSTDTLGTPALNVDRMGIGIDYGQSATKIYTGYFKKLAYYPARLTNAEITALTEE